MWIETRKSIIASVSLPVTPHTGVWIETFYDQQKKEWGKVTPHTGVWIETHCHLRTNQNTMSRPTRACGLKLVVVGVGELVGTVTPHTGRVD